jgi:hypothetical protein
MRQHFEQQTWIDPEEFAYPAGSLRQSRRKFRALLTANTLTGETFREKLSTKYVGRYVSGIAGIPDTYFTIPARCKDKGRTLSGYLSVDSSGALIFSVPSKKVQPNPRKNPGRGPGKFDSDLDELVYQLSLDGADETMGSVDEAGFYALLTDISLDDIARAASDMNLKSPRQYAKTALEEAGIGGQLVDTGKGYIHAIMDEDSQGFVGFTYYSQKNRALAAWKALENSTAMQWDEDEED